MGRAGEAVAGGTGEDPGESGVTEGTPRKGLLQGRGCGRRFEQQVPFFLSGTHSVSCLPQDGRQLGTGA